MSILFRTSTLPLKRYSPGYSNEDGDWIEGSTTETTFQCNWQPYQTGHNQETALPSGIKSHEAYIAYTQTPIRSANEFTFELADRTVYGGRQYYAYASADWTKALSGVGSGNVDHYEVIFIRLPKDPGH